MVELDRPSTASARAPTRERPAIEVLYRDRWPADSAARQRSVRLLGVDADRGRLFLRLEARSPPYYAIDTVDYRSGQRIDRWEARGGREDHPATTPFDFVPLTGSFEADLARVGGMMGACHPWHNVGEHSWPIDGVSPDNRYLLYTRRAPRGRGSEWLTLAEADGRTVGVLDERLHSSYRPVFAPSGDSIAWYACVPHTFRYGVYLSSIAGVRAGAPARRVPGLEFLGTGKSAARVQWGRRGRYLYTVGDVPARASRCFVRIDTHTLGVHPLRCHERIDQFSLDVTSRTAVVVEDHGEGSNWRKEYEWVRLPDGKRLGKQTAHRSSGHYVTPRGVLLLQEAISLDLVIVDLEDGRRARIAKKDTVAGVYNPRFIGKDRLLMLMQHVFDEDYELWALDLQRLLDEPAAAARGALPAPTEAPRP